MSKCERPPMGPLPPRCASLGREASQATSHAGGSTQIQSSSYVPEENDTEVSYNSRTSLRRELVRRRNTLTKQENNYLEELLIRGQEIEVHLATQKLLDEDLFFHHDNDGWKSETIQVGRETSVSSSIFSTDQESYASLPEDDVPAILSTPSIGSDARNEWLQERRNSALFSGIWRAHETGINVVKANRKSISRHASFVMNNTLNNKSLTNSTQDVFRGRRSPIQARSSMKMNRPQLRRMLSDGGRRRSIGGGGGGLPHPIPKRTMRTFSDDASLSQVLLLPPPIPNRRPMHMRALSTSSVPAWHLAPLPPLALEEIPSIRLAHPVQSPTTSSGSNNNIPSIHLAHPVQSPIASEGKSIATVPSIHLAHPVQSPIASEGKSIATVPSIHLAHPIESPASSVKTNVHDSQMVVAIPAPLRKVLLTSSDAFGSDHVSWDMAENLSEEKKADDGVMVAEAAAAAWASPVPTVPVEEEADHPTTLTDPFPAAAAAATTKLGFHRPVLMRDASMNVYNGEGIEVADWDTSRLMVPVKEPLAVARTLNSLVSFGEMTTASSFDETMSYDRVSNIFRRRSIPRSLSDEDVSMYEYGSYNDSIIMRIKEVRLEEGSVDEEDLDYYDPWKVIDDDYANGYGGGDTLPFMILGTSADDVSACPHVLSPPLMESIQNFLPSSKLGENFWMKYSLVRDGASLHSFLRQARGAQHTILAIETVEGEVFGAYTAEPWRKNWNYFGSAESFLWRMRHSRREKTHSIIDQAQMESEIEVYPCTGENTHIQLCTQSKIAVGGGAGEQELEQSIAEEDSSPVRQYDWGFGLTVENDFLHGTTSPCLTFGSPSLSMAHSDGSIFEITNLELWTFTPCIRLDDAEKLELGKLFLEEHRVR